MIAPPTFQDLDFTIAYGQSVNLDLSQVKGRAYLAVDNPGSYWIHLPQVQGAFAWVPPTTFGWIAPLPFIRPANLTVNTTDLPSGYSADASNQTATASVSVLSDFPRISLGVQQVLNTKVAVASATKISDVGPITGAQALLDFNNLPQSYKALELRFVGRGNALAQTAVRLVVQVNGDNVATDYMQEVLAVNNSAGTDTGGNTNVLQVNSSIPGPQALANAFAEGVFRFPLYASTTQLKSFDLDLLGWSAATFLTSGLWAYRVSYLWNSLSAITRLTLALDQGSWDVGSYASIWGVP